MHPPVSGPRPALTALPESAIAGLLTPRVLGCPPPPARRAEHTEPPSPVDPSGNVADQRSGGPDTAGGPWPPIPDVPAVFSSPGHLQPAALSDENRDAGQIPAVWLVLDHAHHRCLGFHTTRAVADAWARFWVLNGIVSREQCSVQGCTLLTEPPDGSR